MEGVCMGWGERNRSVQDTVTRKLKVWCFFKVPHGDHGDLVFDLQIYV